MKNMIRLGIILSLYATAACVGLAFVYAGTKTIIEQRQKSDLESALKDLFPAADSFDEISGQLNSSNTSVIFDREYLVKSGSDVIGIAIRAVGASYGGKITVLAGVGTNRKVAGVKILDNKDTPGLGANAASPAYFVDRKAGLTFYGQFKDKAISDAFQVQEDVIAITASTITSKAVTGAVKAVADAAATWMDANILGVAK